MSSGGNLSTAVRNQRAPRLIEADDATRALWRKLDWFATPPWATRAGAELIKQIDPQAKIAFDPACGDRIMADVLEDYFEDVFASDIYPQTGRAVVLDFLDERCRLLRCDWIITNPPFALAKQFAERALTIARTGVAMLCRLNWLESADRYDLFNGAQPLSFCFPSAERVPMQLGPWDPDCSTATAYAWFVWYKPIPPIPRLKSAWWLGEIIPPGTRARLTKSDDVRRFCKQTEAPLLD